MSLSDDELMNFDSEHEVDGIATELAQFRENTVLKHYDLNESSNYQYNLQVSKYYTKQMIYFIVDTNFIISHLQLLDNLVSLWEFYHRLYQVIIPIQVIQELDGLKSAENSNNTSKHSLSSLAKRAIDWCYTHLHNVSPQIRGQKLVEKIDESAAKDNSILDCSLYFKYKEQDGGSMVVLLTNDKNLCNKALINSILTVSFRPNMTANLIAEMAVMELMSGGGGQDIINLIDNNSRKETVINDDSVEMNDEMIVDQDLHNETEFGMPSKSQSLSSVANDVYEQTEILVKEAITFAVHLVFGDSIGLSGYDPENIKNLTDAAFCIQKMHISTFNDFFQQRSFLPSRVLKSRNKLKSLGSIPKTIEELKEFESFWKQFLQGIYKERTEDQRSSLKQIVDYWEHLINQL